MVFIDLPQRDLHQLLASMLPGRRDELEDMFAQMHCESEGLGDSQFDFDGPSSICGMCCFRTMSGQ